MLQLQTRARVAGTGKAVVSLLAKVDFTKLTEPQQLDLLRAIELNFIRLGDPDTETKKLVSAALSPSYPAKTNSLNRELSKLLVYIDAPKAVEKTMALLASAKDDAPAQKSISESSDLILRNPQYGMDIASMLSTVGPPLHKNNTSNGIIKLLDTRVVYVM